jgi:hypothetical protein
MRIEGKWKETKKSELIKPVNDVWFCRYRFWLPIIIAKVVLSSLFIVSDKIILLHDTVIGRETATYLELRYCKYDKLYAKLLNYHNSVYSCKTETLIKKMQWYYENTYILYLLMKWDWELPTHEHIICDYRVRSSHGKVGSRKQFEVINPYKDSSVSSRKFITITNFAPIQTR